ncbi:MAG: hypothetical protein ACRCXZ_05360 [Patescibacteria group bacterium]
MKLHFGRLIATGIILGLLTNCTISGVRNDSYSRMPEIQVTTNQLNENQKSFVELNNDVIFDWALEEGETRDDLLKKFKIFNGNVYKQNQSESQQLKLFLKELKKTDDIDTASKAIKPLYFAYHYGIPVMVLSPSDYQNYYNESSHGVYIRNVGVILQFGSDESINQALANHEFVHAFQNFLSANLRYGYMDKSKKSSEEFHGNVYIMKKEGVAFLLTKPSYIGNLSDSNLISALFDEDFDKLSQDEQMMLFTIADDIRRVAKDGDQQEILKTVKKLQHLLF